MNEHKNNHFLNEVAIYLIIKFLKSIIRKPEDLEVFRLYYFDLPQFEIDLCKAIDDFLVNLQCQQHLSQTARFVCRERTTVYRNTKKAQK